MDEIGEFVGKTIKEIKNKHSNELTIIFTDNTELTIEANCYAGELEFNIYY